MVLLGLFAITGAMPAADASTVVIGDPAWRAPDGVGVARVAADGSVWTLSKRGEVTGFEPDGQVVTTFQACPDRGVHLELVIDAGGTSAGVDCGPTFSVFDLPSGEERFAIDAFTVDAAFSPDGREIAVLGERIVDGVSEEKSWLLRYDARSGEPLPPMESDWEALWGVSDGWVGARIDGDRIEGRGTLVLEARNQVGMGAATKNVVWKFKAPDDQRTTWDWGARQAVAVIDDGRRVCVQVDFGGVCLDGRIGAVRQFWSVPKNQRSERTRARPHPDGLAVGEELWFLRGSGADEAVWRWPVDQDPVIQPMPEGVLPFVPASDPSGRHRVRVETARVVPVDADNAATLPDAQNTWDRPVSVDRTADGQTLALVDAMGRVFVGRLVGGSERIQTPGVPGSATSVRIEPDGQAVWVFSEEGPTVRIPLDGSSRTTSSTPAVAFVQVDGRPVVLGIGESEGQPHVGPVFPGSFEPWTPVAEALEVTGLQASPMSDPQRLLVEYAQDDAFHPYTRDPAEADWVQGELGAHPFLRQTDIELGAERVFTMEESDDGWTAGPTTVPFTTSLRWFPEAAEPSLVHLADDSNTLNVVNSASAGSLTHTLPGRGTDLWTFEGVVVVALADGRLVLFEP